MAEQQQVFSVSQFQEMMRTLVAELRKPPVDPLKEAQKKREQETKQASNDAMWKRRAEKKRNCAHSRQDGNCVIAWATQSDGTTRGYCPNCDSTFGPEDGELYIQQIKRPRGLIESVRYVA